MARFYGTIQSESGKSVNRTGRTRIAASARSWNGSVTVEMEEDEVTIRVGEGSTTEGRILFAGPLSELLTATRLAVPK